MPRHRAALLPTTADGRLLGAASAQLGSDTAVGRAVGLSRWQLSRVRGGVAGLSDASRAALRAVAAGERVPRQQAPLGGLVWISLTAAEDLRLRTLADDAGLPIQAVLSEAVAAYARRPGELGERPPGARARRYRVDPEPLEALLAAIREQRGPRGRSPGPWLREAVVREIDRGR